MIRHLLKWSGLSLLILVLLALCWLRFVTLPDVDADFNPVLQSGPYPVSETVRSLHQQAFVADMHADPLLWGRDLSQRYARGHVDLPRLREGGVDLQVFGVVTSTPRQLNFAGRTFEVDALSLLYLGAWRSPSSWFDLKQRALVQANELHALARAGEIRLVLRRDDLEQAGLKGLLAVEGLHALQGEIDAVDELYAAGYRMMGFAHLFDNDVSGSSFGRKRYGLTSLGRELVPRMENLGITLDLAHSSPVAFYEALELATRPVVVSHGGVTGTCPGPRNLDDSQLRAIARNGGVVGIGYWRVAVCQPNVQGIVAAIQHAVGIAGIDHVGLGSDFDGTVAVPFDTTGLPLLTEALLEAGFSQSEIFQILGGNVLRVLRTNLPR